MNWQAQARCVIIGAGIVGCSAAYHLAQQGWQDVVVLDKGALFENDGSTSHAPGGMHLTHPSKMMTQFAHYSTKLYAQLPEYEAGRPPFRPVGGLEVATTDERWQDLKRKQGIATAYDIEAHLVTPEEARHLLPLIDPRTIKGAFYCPQDANVIGWHIAASLATEATRMNGTAFHENTTVQEIVIEKGRVQAVVTNRGRIACEHVLLAANIWSPVLTEKAGMRLPLLAAEHQYTVTTPLEPLAGETREIVHPIMRHQDAALYFRQHGDAYGVGSYNHEALLVDPHKVGKTALHDFTPQHFTAAWQAATQLLPSLRGADLTRKFNGMFSFTIDGYPIMGETSVRGFWTAVGVWITHAGGVGKAIAEWMTAGSPELDCYNGDVRRFHEHQQTRQYIQLRCANNYDEVYDIHHPREPMKMPRKVRTRPMHQRFEEHGAVCIESAGWEIPQWYESNAGLLAEYGDRVPQREGWAAQFWSPIQGAEHLAVRERVGLSNVSALAILEVSGPGAAHYVEYLTANRVVKPAGYVTYTAMLNERGGIKADVTVVCVAADRFWILTGGGLVPHDKAWIEQHAPDDVTIRDYSRQMVGIGLWGPRARDVLAQVTPDDVSNEAFPFYRYRQIEIDGVVAHALRLSYIGELGWELHVSYDNALRVWDALWDAGQAHGMILNGAGSVDSLRLEKGFRLWGGDISTEYNPYEAGLGWAVKLDQEDFIGREALLRAKEQGITQHLTCLTSDDPRVVLLGGEPIMAGIEKVGYVNAANYGYSIGRFIAYGYLPTQYTEAGTALQIIYEGERYPFVVSREPLFDPKMHRMKA